MRPQIVLFGDSITQLSFAPGGWGASIADAYSRKVDVVLRGYSGYNTRWAMYLLQRLFPVGSATHPLAVTVFFGANDAALVTGPSSRQHVPLEEYKGNLRKIVRHIKNLSPNTLVLLITPPPIDLQGRREFARSMLGDSAWNVPDRMNEVAGAYAENCVGLAKQLGLPWIDLWSKMQEHENWPKKFLSDGLHLTPEGNSFVFQQVMKIFNEAGFSDLPFDFPPNTDIDGENPDKTFSTM